MKIKSVFAIVAVLVTLFLAGIGTKANAVPAFSFSFSAIPVLYNPGVAPYTFSYSGSVTGAGYGPNGTLQATDVGGKYDITLTDGSVFNVITNGSYQFIGAPFFAIVSADPLGSLNITGLGKGVGAVYSPVPEASSIVGLGAMLLAGGLVFFASKRRASSTIA